MALGRMLGARRVCIAIRARSLSALAPATNPQPGKLEQADMIDKIVAALEEKPRSSEGAIGHVLNPLSYAALGHDGVSRVLERLSDGGTALRFFHWASTQSGFAKHNFDAYKLAIQRLASSGLGKEARSLLREMYDAGFYLKKKVYAAIVSELLKVSDQSEHVVGIAEDLLDNQNISDAVVNALIQASYESKKPSVASEILEKMVARGASPDKAVVSEIVAKGGSSEWWMAMAGSLLKKESDYNMVVDLLCKQGLLEQACNVVDKMVEAGYEPSSFVYARLVDGFLRDSKFSEAQAVLDVMVEQGVIPSTIIYNQLIDGFCKMQRLKEAFELLEKMVENGRAPTIFTYNMLINGLCLKGKTADARKFLQRMEEAGCAPDVITYTVLINRLRRDGDYKGAVDVFDEMVAKGCIPDKASFSPLLISLCRGGCIQLVSSFVDKHKRRVDLDSYLYNLLLTTFAKHGRVEEARRIFEDIESPELFHFNSFMSALCQRKLVGEAFQVYDKLLKRSIAPDTYTYTILIGGLCDVGRTDEALAMKETMIQNNCRPDKVTYGVLRAGLVRAGKRAEADQLQAQMPQMFSLSASPPSS